MHLRGKQCLEVILLFIFNSNKHDISIAHKSKNAGKIKYHFALNDSDFVFILLINIKMPTVVDIVTFMNMFNDILKCFAH